MLLQASLSGSESSAPEVGEVGETNALTPFSKLLE